MAQLPVHRHGRIVNYTIISDEDFDHLSKYRWFLSPNGYVSTSNGGYVRKTYLHRIIMGITKADRNVVIDHIDRNKLNNVRENLRITNHHKNALNKDSKGVELLTDSNRTKPYRARIKLHGKSKTLGYFTTEQEAIDFRKNFLKEYLQ